MAEPITMRRWVFDEARGKYDIDLGDSNVDCGTVRDLFSAGRDPGDLLGLELDYGTDRGTERLGGLIADRYGREPSEVGVAHGAQEALYLLYRTLLRPGDEVVTFMPGWPQAQDVPASIGCHVNLVLNDPSGGADIGRAMELLGPRTRMVVLNSPCNPTGRRVSAGQVAELAAWLRRYGTFLVLDEEYVADLRAESLLGVYERTVSVSSVSKIYGFPGLRTGWMCGPAETVSAAMRYKHNTTISNSVLSEELAARVLERHEEYALRYQSLAHDGLEILRNWIHRHQEIARLVEPEGTPFAWLELRIPCSSLALCRLALEQVGVLLMPAEVFDAEAGVRITFARRPSVLREGLDRLSGVLDKELSRAADLKHGTR
jgi:aspartate/methionine/tyrosine aminotransferase